MLWKFIKSTFLLGAFLGTVACNNEAPRPRQIVKCDPNAENCTTSNDPKTDTTDDKDTAPGDKALTDDSGDSTQNPKVLPKDEPPKEVIIPDEPKDVPPETPPETPPEDNEQLAQCHISGDHINFRTGASINSSVIKTLSKNTTVFFIEKTSTPCVSGSPNRWTKIKVDNTEGYSCSNYVACQ